MTPAGARELPGAAPRIVERRIAVEGVELHVRIEEAPGVAATPVVILHGFTGSAQSMSGVAQHFRAERSTVCVDLVGHGASDAPGDRTRYTMDCCVAQLRGVVEELELVRPHWIGYSMGGRAVLSLCVAHPEAVASALLVGATAGLADGAARAERRRSDEALAARILEEGVEAFVDHWMALPLFSSQQRLGRVWLAADRAQRQCNRPQGLALSLRGMGTGAMAPLHAALDRIEASVCLVVGEEDVKFRTIAEELAPALQRGRVELIPEAGHAAHLENPAAFARVARRFFDGVDAARRA